MPQSNIPRNTAASMYNAWFRKEYPELFECEIAETVENCGECGFCELKAEKATAGNELHQDGKKVKRR